MQDKSSNPLGLAPSTWITMAVAVMGIFALKQYPFQDARPTDLWVPVYSHTATEDQDIEARLWQDPMAAVETARRLSEGSAKVTVVAVKGGGGNTAGATAKSFSCIEKALSTRATENADPDTHSSRHLCDSIAKRMSSAGVLVLGAMVSGAPYAADIEDRRRIRYAVLAGLYRSRYMPVNNQHVGYVRLAEYYDDPTRANDLSAFEWFVSDDAAKKPRAAQVLLLWLDQDGFRKDPIKQLSKVVDGVVPHEVPIVMLGPADSDGLQAMASEYKDEKSHPTANLGSRDFSMYSPWATASLGVIGPQLERLKGKSLQGQMVGVRLYRAVVTDDDVTSAVRGELADRGIEPAEIALIAERDTLYARSMGKYFDGCVNPARDDPGSVDAEAQSRPLCLTYLKGLDGIGPPPPKQAGAPTGANASDVKASEPPSRANAAQDASTGPRQLDYLRRMGVALRAMQGAPVRGCSRADVHEQGCQPRFIKAIGVLGTDIYDKLLVLQELRPMFPDVVFFTFGLDARYTDDANLAWTRQLLVGGSMGLSLRPELQGDIPPFRDGDQTTAFYSTLLALHRADSKHVPADDDGLQWTSKAMVFEIGRKQPLDLLIDPDAGKTCDFDGKCPSISANRTTSFTRAVTQGTASGLIVLVPLVLWGMLRTAFGNAAMWRRSRALGLSLTVLMVVVAIAAFLAMRLDCVWYGVHNSITGNGHHMPVPIADGASHWGRELLEACLIPLVVTLLIRGQRKLNASSERMRQEFHFSKTYRQLTRRYGAEVGGWSWKRKAKEWTYFPFGSLSNDEDKAPTLAGISAMESLIARYLYRGIGPRRFLRVVIATGVFVVVLKVLEGLGFSFFADVPWAGTQIRKHGTEGWIAFLCVVCVQVLIFWVIDAILLTRAFLLAVAHTEPGWPKDPLGRTHPELGLPEDLAPIWLDLCLIARRTHWVGDFIWYPSLVIAGMFAITFTVEYGQYRFESNPVTLLVSIGLIVSAVVALRGAAESWRAELLRRLEHRRLALLAAEAGKPAEVAQLEVLIDLVTELHHGAFAPYSEQPLVRAVLLPAVTFAATAGVPFLRGG